MKPKQIILKTSLTEDGSLEENQKKKTKVKPSKEKTLTKSEINKLTGIEQTAYYMNNFRDLDSVAWIMGISFETVKRNLRKFKEKGNK